MKQKTERQTCEVHDCPECDGRHEEATVYPLVAGRKDGWTHAVICPTTGNEILVRMEQAE